MPDELREVTPKPTNPSEPGRKRERRRRAG
jgi:hypothetical protein